MKNLLSIIISICIKIWGEINKKINHQIQIKSIWVPASNMGVNTYVWHCTNPLVAWVLHLTDTWPLSSSRLVLRFYSEKFPVVALKSTFKSSSSFHLDLKAKVQLLFLTHWLKETLWGFYLSVRLCWFVCVYMIMNISAFPIQNMWCQVFGKVWPVFDVCAFWSRAAVSMVIRWNYRIN